MKLLCAMLVSLPLPAVVSDAGFTSFVAACAAAASEQNPDRTLTLSKVWPSIPTQTCKASLIFLPGATLQLARGAILNLGPVNAPVARIFDISLGGEIFFGSDSHLIAVYPQWWGAKGDGLVDDTSAIQAAIDSVRGNWSGHAFSALAPVCFPAGKYRTTAQLRIYGIGHPGAQGYENYILMGTGGTQAAEIGYSGPSNQSAIRWIGGFGEISRLSFVDNGSGWTSGINYDGDPEIGRSTKGVFSHILVDCNGKPGDGIAIGVSHHQADQLSIRDPYLTGCTSGAAVNVLDANALSINLYNPSIGNSWIGVRGTAPGINIGIFGGEIDNNDVNFLPAAGEVWIVSGVRSENSKRTLFTNGGTYSESFTLENYSLSNIFSVRPRATVTAAAGSTSVLLSSRGFTFGDAIVLAGAGKDGRDIHTIITSMTNPLTAILGLAPIVTSVTNARISLDRPELQNDLVENGGGPYVHLNNHFAPHSGATANPSNATQIFIGNGWTDNLPNPFGQQGQGGSFQSAVLLGNLVDTDNSVAPMSNVIGQTMREFAPNASSQDVSRGNVFGTSNSSDTIIDTLAGCLYGQRIQVNVRDSHTLFTNAGNMEFPGISPIRAVASSTWEFFCRSTGGALILLANSGR